MGANPFKMPEITRLSGVERMPSVDPDMVVSAGQASAAAWGSWSAALKNVSETYRKNQSQESTRNAILHKAKKDTDFEATWSKQREVIPIDVDNDQDFLDILVEKGVRDFTQPIPMHSIYPEWKRRQRKRSLEEASAMITDQESKDAFNTQYAVVDMKAFVQDSEVAVVEQQRYIKDKADAEILEAVRQGNHDLAIQVINSGPYTPGEKQNKINNVMTLSNKDFFSSTLTNHSDNREYLEFALKQARDRESPYSKYLNEDEREAEVRKLSSQIHVLDTAIKGADRAATTLALKHLRELTDLQNDGKAVDTPSSVSEKLSELAETNPGDVEDYVRSSSRQPILNFVSISPNDKARETIDNFRTFMKQQNKETDRVCLQELEKMEDAFSKASDSRLRDPLGWAATELQLPVNSPDLSSPEALADSIAGNITTAVHMMSSYGAEETLLSDKDLSPFVNFIETRPDPFPWINAITQRLGDKAQPLYNQLAKAGMGKGWIHAARVNEYDPRTAELIVKGGKELKENPLVQTRMKQDSYKIEEGRVSDIGSIYMYNTPIQASIAEAYTNLYAMIPDQQSTFKDKLFGGTITWNGSTFAAPVPGMSEKEFIQMIKGMPQSWWESQAALTKNYTGKSLRESILKGNLQIHSYEPGAYILLETNGNRIVARSKDSWDRSSNYFLFKPRPVKVDTTNATPLDGGGATYVAPTKTERLKTPHTLSEAENDVIKFLNQSIK